MLDDIHDALLARLEELRVEHVTDHAFSPHKHIEVAINLAIAYVNERCPKCGDRGHCQEYVRSPLSLPGGIETGSIVTKVVCYNPRHALLADYAEKLGIGGKG